jgi:hypothetical protein
MALDLGGLHKPQSKPILLDQKKIDEGVWIGLFAPTPDEETGQPVPLLLNDNPETPMRARVRSHRCSAIKELEKKRQKDGFVKIRLAKKRERDGVIAETSILPEGVRFGCLLVALDNFGSNGGVQQVTSADAESMHEMLDLDDIVQQIKEAAYDDDLFMADGTTEPGNVLKSAPSPTPEPTANEGQDQTS